MVNYYIIGLLSLVCQIFANNENVTSDDYRLPTTIYPTDYEVHITITNTSFTSKIKEYFGSVIININVVSQASEIKLHSNNEYITIENITLDDVYVPENGSSRNFTTDILTIIPENPLKENSTHVLKIFYTSVLSSWTRGFFSSSYVNDNGDTIYLAATQFEPTYARMVFPCWDEPGFKAKFQIKVSHPTNLNALSNMPGKVVAVDQNENLATTQFEKSPEIPTYLIALVVSDLTCTDREDGEILYKVCSRNEFNSTRELALELGPKVIEHLNEYTGINYTDIMHKMDQVAVPGFTGGMENWGLITYGEEALLWDSEKNSNSRKQNTALVITHEIAHQWFGNLVTCKWWSSVFLSEGFAQFYQYHLLQEILPEWELDNQFVITVLQSALEYDSQPAISKALETDASTPQEISTQFGTLTYNKGASIFNMVEKIMGSENFRNGIRTYLQYYKYSNVEPEDLWTILNENVNIRLTKLPTDLGNVMENWVKNAGYPLLTVATDGKEITITQKRFLQSQNDGISKWYVPVAYTTSEDTSKFDTTTPDFWLEPDVNVTTIPHPKTANWIILNNQHAGFYRVTYDDALWENIAVALRGTNFSGIPELNRAQIADDLFALIKVSKITYARTLQILEYLENEVSYYPWYAIRDELDVLLLRVPVDTELGVKLNAHLSKLSERFYDSSRITKIDEENQIYTLKQVFATALSCRVGNQHCIDDTKEIFSSFKNDDTIPPKNVKYLIYCNGVKSSTNESDWEFLYEVYKNSQDSVDRQNIIKALGCSADKDVLKKYLNMSITDDTEVGYATSAVFAAVYSNQLGFDVAFDFLIDNHMEIYNHLNDWVAVGNILKDMSFYSTTTDQLEKLKNVLSSEKLNIALRGAASTAISTIETNLQWLGRYEYNLKEYFNTDETTVIRSTSTEASTITYIHTTPGGATSIQNTSTILFLIFILLNTLFLK